MSLTGRITTDGKSVVQMSEPEWLTGSWNGDATLRTPSRLNIRRRRKLMECAALISSRKCEQGADMGIAPASHHNIVLKQSSSVALICQRLQRCSKAWNGIEIWDRE
jgi:hypothetical protein